MIRNRLFLVLFLGVILPSHVFAWTPIGATWPAMPVPYNIHGLSSQELGADSSIAVIQASYESWTSPACSAYRVQYRGTTSQSWTSGDGVNTHQWVYSSNQRPPELGGRETIGVTLSLYRGTTLVDGDIIYNGIDHQWTTRATRTGEVDAQSIITHEVGHQLGLGHSSSSGATMYPSYGGGEGPRSLHQDDVEGVCTLYPNDISAQCSSNEECVEGQECVQEQCVNISSGEGQVGDDCSFAPCEGDLICVQGQDQSTFCTRFCSDGLCPGGWACYAVNSSQGEVNICLPAQNEQGDLSFGTDCESGPECISGLCVSDGQRNFCSQSCTQNEDCPNQAQCAGLSNGGGACIPNENQADTTPFGTPCEQPSDCSNSFCLDDNVEVYCTYTCETDRDCPENAACFEAGTTKICAKVERDMTSEAGTEAGSEAGTEAGSEAGSEIGGSEMMSGLISYGDPCTTASECTDDLCLSDGISQFCSAYCDTAQDCPNNDECVRIGDDEGGCLPGSYSASGDMTSNDGSSNDDNTDSSASTMDDDDSTTIEDNIGCASYHRHDLHIWLLLLLSLFYRRFYRPLGDQ